MERTLFLGSTLLLVLALGYDERHISRAEADVPADKSTDVHEERESDPKFSAEAEAKAKALQVTIVTEAKSLEDHAWAGQYYCGDGLGVNVSLSLAPKNGCIFEWHGCLGVYDRNFGPVTEKDGRLLLTLEFPNRRQGFQGIADEFVPITWGERHYLIPAEDVVGFCNDINDGSEPRDGGHGSYLLKVGDEKLAAKGTPALSDEYKKYLLAQPIEAEITVVGAVTQRTDREWGFTTVTMKPGKASGLLPGMKLYVNDPDVLVEWVEITKIDDETCDAVMTRIDENEQGPKVGWKLSTRPHWRSALEGANLNTGN